ncbi:MAG: hypothetical protein JO257_22980 [Deltaproteobacteria bacterium]|nr:hypothetical protein [Deltaproteobacteria bacterium]
MRAPLPVASSIAAISAIGIMLAFAPAAHAQNAAAESLFNDGERLMKEGKLAEACQAFEASNRVEARAGTLINLGLCREQNNQLASAWSAFKDALTRAKDPKKQQLATEHANAIEPRLSYLTISVPDDSRVDGLALSRNTAPVDPVLWNRAIPVDGGTYVIAGHAPGHEEWSTTVEVPNEGGKISVEVPRFKDLTKLMTPVAAQPRPAEPPPAAHDEPEPSGSMFTPRRKLALGVGGVGVVALAAGAVLGIQAKGFKDDAFKLCPDPATPCADGDRATALTDKGHSRAVLADVSFGVGAAALIGAGILWFVGAPTDADRGVAVTPRVSGGTAALDLTVRF